MKVKVGDKVKVLAGKDKGKEGTITTILRKKDKVVVSGINMVTKHIKPNGMSQSSGGIVQVEAPIHVSNVKVIESGSTKKETKAAESKKTTAKKEPAKRGKTTKKEVGDENE